MVDLHTGFSQSWAFFFVEMGSLRDTIAIEKEDILGGDKKVRKEGDDSTTDDLKLGFLLSVLSTRGYTITEAVQTAAVKRSVVEFISLLR